MFRKVVVNILVEAFVLIVLALLCGIALNRAFLLIIFYFTLTIIIFRNNCILHVNAVTSRYRLMFMSNVTMEENVISVILT